MRERKVSPGEGIIGTAALERTPVLSPDVRKDPRYRTENPETRSELAVPLLYKGRVIGVIDLEHTRVNYYNEDHQRTLTTLAAQVAISIANARLYQRLAEEEHRMEARSRYGARGAVAAAAQLPSEAGARGDCGELSAGALDRRRPLRLPGLWASHLP